MKNCTKKDCPNYDETKELNCATSILVRLCGFYEPEKSEDKGPKETNGKTKWEVFPWPEAEQVCKAFEYGAQKYDAAFTYRRGIAVEKLAAATIRHCVALLNGERVDIESGLYHAAHISANGMMIISQSIAEAE